MDELLSKDNIYYRDLTREIAQNYVRPIAAEHDRDGEQQRKAQPARNRFPLQCPSP